MNDRFLAEQFLQQLHNDNTRRSYRATIYDYITKFPGCLTEYAQVRKNIREWMKTLSCRDVSLRTKLAAITSFFGWLVAEGYRKDNPAQRLATGVQVSPIRKQVSPETIKHIIDVAKKDERPLGLRNQAIVMLLFSGGFRISELLELRVSDVNGKKITIRNGKRGHHRVTGISQDCLEVVQKWIAKKNLTGDDLLFNITPVHVNKIIAKLADKAGVKRVSAHDFRHAWATEHVRRGTDYTLLLLMGGWTTTRMLDIYVTKEDIHPIGV